MVVWDAWACGWIWIWELEERREDLGQKEEGEVVVWDAWACGWIWEEERREDLGLWDDCLWMRRQEMGEELGQF